MLAGSGVVIGKPSAAQQRPAVGVAAASVLLVNMPSSDAQTPCSVPSCKQNAVPKCENLLGPVCGRHGCQCGKHYGIKRKRGGLGIPAARAVRWQEYTLRSAVQPVMRLIVPELGEPLPSPVVLINHLIDNYDTADNVPTDDAVVQEDRFCTGVPSAILRKALSAIGVLREKAARKRLLMTDVPLEHWRAKGRAWMITDMLKIQVLPSGRAAELASAAAVVVSDDDSDWGEWSGAAGRTSASSSAAAAVAVPRNLPPPAVQIVHEPHTVFVPMTPPRRAPATPRPVQAHEPAPAAAEQVCLHICKDDAARRAAELDQDVQCLLRPAFEIGRFMWDGLALKVEPHIRRSKGSFPPFCLHGQHSRTDPDMTKHLAEYANADPEHEMSVDRGIAELLAWLHHRDGVWRNIRQFEVHSDLKSFGADQHMPPGKWLYAQLDSEKHPVLELPADKWCFGFHGTSMYCAARILHNKTLAEGFASLTISQRKVMGIFFHYAHHAYLCQATYMHYCALVGGPWAVAPLVVLECNMEPLRADGSSRKFTAQRPGGKHQQLTYEGDHRVLGVLWHLVHINDVILHRDKSEWFNIEPAFLKELELQPTTSWDKILAFSKQEKDREPLYPAAVDPAVP